VKGVIDVLGQRGGQALAAIVILMLLSTTQNLAVFAALACLTTVGWLVVAVSLREPYLDLFRQTLHSGSEPRGSGFPALDMASLETLMATLNTSDDRRVVAALDLLETQGKVAVVPAPLLYHPSTQVVVRSLDLFTAGGRDDALPMVDRLLLHGNAEVRAASLRALSALDPRRAAFEEALGDPDRGVQVTAQMALVACGWSEERDLARDLREAVTHEDAQVQMAAARALRVRPSARLEGVLLDLLAAENRAVLVEAIHAARALRTPALVEPLIALLRRRAVRDEVRGALAIFGPLALERLGTALESREVPHGIRRHVPGAIALVGSVRAPEILLRHLEHEPDGMIRFKVLRALGRWRREQPSFPLDVGMLQAALGYAVSTGFRLMEWRHALTHAARDDGTLRTELHDVLVALLRDKQDNALERIFRLLNLQSGSEEFQRVYRGLHSPQAASRAGSRELLHHMVLPPIRGPLMTLVDDLHGESDEEPDLPARREELRAAYARILAEIASCGMESASSLAAAHAVELSLVELTDPLKAVEPVSVEHRLALSAAVRRLAVGAP
jgi:HEAT repeat protein